MKQSWIAFLAMGLAVVFALGLLIAADGVTPAEQEILLGQEMAYEETLFDNSKVHIIDIQVTEADWAHLKAEAMSKECIDGTVVIDGETVHHVGVRTKGIRPCSLTRPRAGTGSAWCWSSMLSRRASGSGDWTVWRCITIFSMRRP